MDRYKLGDRFLYSSTRKHDQFNLKILGIIISSIVSGLGAITITDIFGKIYAVIFYSFPIIINLWMNISIYDCFAKFDSFKDAYSRAFKFNKNDIDIKTFKARKFAINFFKIFGIIIILTTVMLLLILKYAYNNHRLIVAGLIIHYFLCCFIAISNLMVVNRIESANVKEVG